VEYFLVHEFNNTIIMLAYVHLTSKVNIDNINCKYFTRFSTKEFIDVRCIDHCVGFIKINNQYFIIDKTNEIDDYNWEILYK
jgi:hypothetical protein